MYSLFKYRFSHVYCDADFLIDFFLAALERRLFLQNNPLFTSYFHNFYGYIAGLNSLTYHLYTFIVYYSGFFCFFYFLYAYSFGFLTCLSNRHFQDTLAN